MVTKSKTFKAFLPSGSSINVKIRGTIQEVLNKLSSLNIKSKQLVFYSDDGTNAEALFNKIR